MKPVFMLSALPLALILLVMPGAQALSTGYPDLKIDVEPSYIYVNYSQYEQKVRFDGYVTLDNPSNVSLGITLWSGSFAWSGICSPSYFSLQDSGVQHFNLTVTVPAGSWNRSQDFWVKGEAHLGGQLVATNESNRVTATVGERPVSGNGDDVWSFGYGSGGQTLTVQSMIVVVLVLAVVVAAGYGFARRRRKRREAAP